MEDIAVVGLGLRFPGDASSPENLWKVLEESKSQWSEFPKDRLDIDGYFHPGGDRQGSISFRGAHFLKGDVAAFDAPFFSTAAEEANAIDPQQRFLLEVTYEALENAGLRKENLDGSDTAVYVGSFVKDYEQICLRDPDWQPRYAATGNGVAIMANRISYFFNFHGPSMTLDTGCSGSLVSVHLAAQSLRNRESSLAIAAGSGMILTPNTIMPMTALNFLSPDGKCFTFDARANGYGRGEGIGVVVMKRLSDALRDNDTIRAVIRGSAVNQDGRTTGITLPSKEAQVANIRSVYAAAGLNFDQTAYVECHGTGTQAGDWRELKAISETIASKRPADRPIIVGSLKPNIGHLEGAAGVAGMIKGVLVLEHGKIPPQINFEKGNPDIDFEKWRVQVPRSLTPWPLAGTRRVSVNCFGFGGTNAHVILDEAPAYLSTRGLTGHHSSLDSEIDMREQKPVNEGTSSASQLFCYSSHEKAGVTRVIDSHLDFFASQKDFSPIQINDYAYTLDCRRSNLEWRTFVVADSKADLTSKIQALDQSSVVRSSREKKPRICFVFCGQGAQWARMGKDLMGFDAFCRGIEEASCHMTVALQAPFDLLSELFKDEKESCISHPHISQPATTAVQVALVDLLNSLGIVPKHVVGHSSGEIAAAYAAGALSRQAAWEVAYYRGLAAASIPFRAPKLKGAMIVVGLSRDEANKYLTSACKSAQIACMNSPRSTTISGRVEAIESIEKEMREKKVFCRVLNVKTAYHSSHMRLVEHDYRESLAYVSPRDCSLATSMFSSVTGSIVGGAELDANYWARNLVSPVQYVAAVEAMMSLPSDEQPTNIIELSPRAALRSPTLDILSSKFVDGPAYHPVLDPKVNGTTSLLRLVGELWSQGYDIGMEAIFSKGRGHPLPKCLSDLPPYPWNHSKSYWHESHLSLANRFRKYGRQDLIGAPTADSVSFEPRWRGFLRVSENPWIQDHRVQKTMVYPAAGMVSMVIEGARQMGMEMEDLLGYEITNMHIEKAMIIPSSAHGLEVALNIKAGHDFESTDRDRGPKQNEFVIYSKPLGHNWERNATGGIHFRVKSDYWNALFRRHDLQRDSLEQTCTEPLNPRQLYEFLDTIGMNYGPLFQNMTEIRSGGKSCLSQVRVPDTKSKMPSKFEYPHLLHPATLDSMFQTLFAIEAAPMVPTFVQRIFVSANVNDAQLSPFTGYATADRTGIRDADATIFMKRPGLVEEAHVIIEGLHLTGLSTPSPAEGGFLPNHRNLCTEIIWEEDATFATPLAYSDQVTVLAHKYPELAVLQVGGGLSATKTTLRHVTADQDETPRLGRYTILESPGDDSGNRAKAQVKGTPLEHLMEVETDFSGLHAEYHLIVVFDDSGVETDRLKRHLKSGGVLLKQKIVTEHFDSAQYSNGVADEPFLEAPELLFDGIDGPSVPMDIFRNGFQLYDPPSLRELVLVLPRDPNTDAFAFEEGLREIVAGGSCPDLGLSSISVATIELNDSRLSGKVVISLLDFTCSSAEGHSVFAWDEQAFVAFDRIQRVAKGIIWITQGANMEPLNPRGAPILALARTLMSEDPLKTIVTFDLGFNSKLGSVSSIQSLLSVYRQTFHTRPGSGPRDTEFAEESGKIYIPRLAPVAPLNRIIEKGDDQAIFELRQFHRGDRTAPDGKPVLKLNIGKPGIGDDSLYYSEVALPELDPDEVEIVFAQAPLTHIDLETVMGRTVDSTIGVDVVGLVRRVGSNVEHVQPDDYVAAMVSGGAIQNLIRAQARFVTKQQKDLIPSQYVSAYIGIIHVGRAGPGRKVLVQSGASAYGLAAVQIAVSAGAEVFATVLGSEPDRQREVLLSCGLPAERIIDARSDGFVMEVQAASDGRGVDVVYNPTLDYVEASVNCVRRCGTVVQFASKSPSPRVMPFNNSSATVVNFDLGLLMAEDEAFVGDMFQQANRFVTDKQMAPALQQPELVHCFGMDKLKEALKHIQGTPYLGYAMLCADARVEGNVPVANKNFTKSLASSLDGDGTYLLAGGLGGLGRSIAEFLVQHGVRHLAFVSRSGENSDKARSFLGRLREKGIDARAYSEDICDEVALEQLLKGRVSTEMPPILGVFQCAAVIKDSVFDNMTFADWNTATRPKTLGSWNLVRSVLAAGHDPFFVFLASSAGVIGNRGQANYAAGNCFEDALARYCRLQGRHAVSIDLGPVLGAGMLTEDDEILDILRASGFYGIRHGDFLRVVEHAITAETMPGRSTPGQVILGVGTGGIIRQNQPADPYWSRTALFSYLNLVDMPPPDLAGSVGAANVDLKTMLACCTDTASATEIVRASLIQMLAKAMNLLPEELDENKPPSAYGVDSLVAVGIRSFVLSSFSVQLSVFEILSDATIIELARAIAAKGGYGVERM